MSACASASACASSCARVLVLVCGCGMCYLLNTRAFFCSCLYVSAWGAVDFPLTFLLLFLRIHSHTG